MQRLSQSRREQLRKATVRYRNAFPGSLAAEYLVSTRGLDFDRLSPFRLGYVGDPEPHHAKFQGMLAIPYLRYNPRGDGSVVSMRFRCASPGCKHEGHPKYSSESGDVGRIFNTEVIADNQDWVCICEGELDAITATLCDVPTVGIPGATHWKPEWAVPFYGFDTVFVFTDGDDSGRNFGETVANSLANAKVIPCPPGEDVNSEYLKFGKNAILRKVQ